MTLTEAPVKQSSRLGRFSSPPSAMTSNGSTVIRASSLLLGVELRGWLSNSEREFLDTLAPDNALTFLVLGENYLHPSEVPLFPSDLIAATVAQGNDSIFSHRCQTARHNGSQSCRVFTGLIGETDGKPLVLGMFGPDDLMAKHLLADRFELAISAFRSARTSAAMLLESLKPLPENAARLIVNRASGRIIHVDNALCAAANHDAFHFVSREYGTVEPLVRRLLLSYKMKMENLACGCLHVTCMTFSPAEAAGLGTIRLHNSLLENFRSKIAAITSTAEFLHSQCNTLAADDIRDLANQIASAGGTLDTHLARLHLLANFDRLEFEPVSVCCQLEQAIDHFALRGDRNIAVTDDHLIETVRLNAPRDAFRLLFNSILDTHRVPQHSGAPTAVRVSADQAGGNPSIVFTTQLPPATRIAELDRAWHPDTDTLARRLGVTLHRKLQLESNSIVTRVTFPAQEIQA